MRNKSVIRTLIFLIVMSIWTASCTSSLKDTESPAYLNWPYPEGAPEFFAPDVVSIEGRFEMGFTMSPDGRTIAFGVSDEKDTSMNQIYFMQREEDGWSQPNTEVLHDNTNTFFPMFAPNGDFYYARAVPGADTDIWKGKLQNGKITSSQPLAEAVNTEYREAGHGLSKDGLFLFTSNRDQAQPWGGDIYQWLENGSVEKVEVLSSDWDEESLFLSPEGDYILFQSWKPEHKSKHDLYISYKTKDGSWSNPMRLPDAINSKEIEQRPFVSPDKEFFFFSRMSVTQVGNETLVDSDIYWVRTNQVFSPFVYNPVSSIEVKADDDFVAFIPGDLFRNGSGKGAPVIRATLVDDSPLPDGFKFDLKKMWLKGNLNGEKSMTIKLTASNGKGLTASHQLTLVAKK